MRWWVVLCVAVLWDTASLQPTRKDDRECCPCPKDSDAASSNTFEAVNPFTAASSVARAAGGCPCVARSADSEGAPSGFLPAAVRAIRPFVSLDDSKEEPKPLLHPEVDLASSVLDTLREATNEEYQEALARDAARAAQEPDGVASESNNLVTVVVSPKDADDVMAEASHAHEARCTHPLSRSSLNLRGKAYDTPELLSILRLPKKKPPTFRAWNLFDMDSGVGASNVNEQVVKPNTEYITDTPKTKNALKLQVPRFFKSNNNGETLSDLILNKLRDSKKVPPKLFIKSGNDNLSLTTNVIDKEDCDSPSAFKLKIPNISTSTPRDDSSSLVKKTKVGKLSTINNNLGANISPSKKIDVPRLPLIPRTSLANIQRDKIIEFRDSDNNLKPNIPNFKAAVIKNQQEPADLLDSDSMNSASAIQERYSSFAKDNADGKDLESNAVETCNDLKIPAVKSINLKNVESNEDVTPEKSNKFKIKVPDLKLFPSKTRDATTDLVNNILKGLKVPNLGNLISNDIFNSKKQDQATKSTEQKEVADVSPSNDYSTEILDTIPSPSERHINHVQFIEKERDDVSEKINEKMQEEIENMPVKTEILDSLPKSSEANDSDNIEEPEVNEIDEDFTNASEQSQKSLANEGEETSEFVNEMEDMNEDIIDDVIDNTNNELVDRESNAENLVDNLESSRGSSDEIGTDQFVDENKIDGLAINSDIQSLNEKSVPDMSFSSEQNVPTFRERLRQKLENLKSPSKIKVNFTKPKSITKSSTLNEDEEEFLPDVQSKNTIPEEQDMEHEDTNRNVDQVNIDDLQQMSDSLLDQEKENKAALDENAELTQNNEQSNLADSDEIPDSNVLETNTLNNVKKVDELCIVNNTPTIKNTEIDQSNEMEVGASERVANIAGPDFNLASPLRQSPILEPISIGSEINLFNRPGLDLSSLFNNPLPALNLPSLLKPREDNNLNLFSFGGDRDSFEDEEPSMSAQPSTSSFRSSRPLLQPLEDINLDILQLKPLSADMPTLPRLNLNSFKTRLALPKSLELKPVLLESSIGNKKGVIGATLTLGSDNKFDPSNLLQEASESLKSSNILRQSLGSLPSLDDLHENFWEKTQDLLTTPLEMTGRNAVEDTLRSGQVLTDNLRVHAENAMKDMHQNLASTFKGVGLQNRGDLRSIKSSGSFLEEISRRHEDVNDRLKGISVDLSDRLESLRDSMFDQYRTPSLGSSLLGQSLFPSLGSSKPSSIFTSHTKPQKSVKLSTKGKFVTPASKRKSTGRKSNKSGLKSASSMVAPKTIEMPKWKAASTESPVLKSLRKDSSFKKPQLLSRDRPTFGTLQPEKNFIDKPLIKKPRLGQSTIKISFSTTPPPPVLRNKPSFRGDSNLTKKPTTLKSTFPKFPKSGSKDKAVSRLRDSSGFASEAIPSRVKSPFRISTSFKSAEDDSDISSKTTNRPKFKLTVTKSKSSQGETDGITSPTENVPRSNDVVQIPALSWPKKIDDEFLTKVREAVRARLADIGKKTAKPIVKTKLARLEPSPGEADDMARSASNNQEVIDPKMMKENTAYTCKMMCTKNT